MQFDLVVIGSGPGGYKAAITAAHLGAKVALVEKGLPGGTCLNQGCIPKKTLLYLAALIEDVNALNGHGLIGQVDGDFPAAIDHKNQVIEGIRNNFPFWLRRLGIRLINGEARFIGPKQLQISEELDKVQTLTAERFIIATGSEPRELNACPTDGTRIINSRHFMFEQTQLPRSVLCLGGGAIGVELAYLMHQFGSRVTIAEQSERLLAQDNIPERASSLLERKFDRLGVTVLKGVTVTDTCLNDDDITVTYSDGTQGHFDQILVAIGRRPKTRELGLENTNVAVDEEGFIVTSDYLETTHAGIYAIGDVTEGPMTANAALHGAKVAATNAITGNSLQRNYHTVPIVIDSAVEIAAVGLTEDQAEDAGFEPDTARSSFGASPKARGRNDIEGFIEVVHDEETGQMLGGCIAGTEAGEQIQMLTAACQSPKGLWFLKDISYSHPSWCEELENTIDPYTSEIIQSGREVFQPGIYYNRDKS
ncbi:MAG: NAD(P)/FAD-dependent oxidoreductase [Gammaproteobacteria bacterium]|nr:NAD(P)/FAD-dependent oxidoreductase [Gammaproteobacteria bacterium]